MSMSIAMRSPNSFTGGTISCNAPGLSGDTYTPLPNGLGSYDIQQVDVRDIQQLMKLGFTVVAGAPVQG